MTTAGRRGSRGGMGGGVCTRVGVGVGVVGGGGRVVGSGCGTEMKK